MLCKSFTVPPIAVDIIFIPLVIFWIVWRNLPIASPWSSIILAIQWLSAYLFAEPWPHFETSNANQLFSLKLAMTSSCHLRKVFVDFFASRITETVLWRKGWLVGSLYLSEGSFPVIPINTSWYLRIVSARTHLNFFLCVSCVLWKNRESEKIHQIRFCFYIVKGWSESPINIILFMEEPVIKSLSTSHVIR